MKGMIGKHLDELDTPSLLIDLDRLERNLKDMQALADGAGAALRPHIKTHKCAAIARLQEAYGAKGITVAKLSEAEAMAAKGLTDIFVATQIVGKQKLVRLDALVRRARVRLAVDSLIQAEQLVRHFGAAVPVEVMIEVDTGLRRCGVEPDRAVQLAGDMISTFPGLKVAGIFTHEGQVYHAADKEQLKKQARAAQQVMVDAGRQIGSRWDFSCEISVGCTLGQLGGGILSGITEIRPGTYVFYDATHAAYWGDTSRCAASILATITSRTGEERAVADAGAKSMTIDSRSSGMLMTLGFGKISDQPGVIIKKLSDEHAILTPASPFAIGDRIRMIPNHICPTVNLYDIAYGIRNGRVESVFQINARGCNQ